MRSFGRRKGYGGPFQYLEERKYFERDFFKDPLFLFSHPSSNVISKTIHMAYI